jgi:hypothetical protein
MSRPWFILCRRLPLAAAWGCALGAGVMFLIGMVGGFDFTDEGAYYLGFRNPADMPDSNTSYRFFGSKLFTLLGHDIVAMRAGTLLAMLVGTLIFLHGWGRFMRRFAPALASDVEQRRLSLAAALTASFLGFAISPATLSYNFQNAFCLLAAGGFLLQAATSPKDESRFATGTLVPLLAFGLLTGLQFFVKFSSGILLVGAGSFFFLAVSEKSPGQKTAFGTLLLAGLGLVAFVYFIFFQSFTRWWNGIGALAHLVTTGQYLSGQLRRYGTEFLSLLSLTLRYFIPVWIIGVPGMIVLFVLRNQARRQARVAVLGGLGVLGTLLWLTTDLGYLSVIRPVGLPYFLGCLILLILLVAVTGFIQHHAGSVHSHVPWRVVLAGGGLFFLPYIGSFGTSNDINQNCLYQLAPWFVLAALLLAELDRQWRTAWLSRIGLLLLTVVAAGQFYLGYWENPYRVTGPRSEQNVPTAIGEPATQLRLTPATHDFIETARRSLQEHGFKKGDDLLVFFDLPGLVFALGGASPRHHWYFGGGQTALDDSALHLSLLDPERRKHAFLVRNSDNDWDTFIPSLRAAGLPFPEGYQLITPPMTSPFSHVRFEIWAPMAAASPR